MKTFSTVIATLLLGAALTVPLGAQLNIAAEGVSDPSVLGETVVFDSDGVGQRVTKRLFLQFDPGGERSLTLRQVRVIGSSEFTYELKGVSRLPAVIRGELEVDLFTSYHPSGPGPAQAVLELTLRIGDSDTDPTLTVYTVNLVGRVPSYTLSYVLPGGARRGVPVAGLVDFGHKPTGTPTEATLVLTNDGSGPGTVRGVRVSGTSAYSLVSPPAFPVRLEPGRALSIQLAFQPTSTSVYRGQVTFDFGVLDSQYVVAGVGGDLLKFRVISYAHDSSTGRSADVQSGSPIVFGQSAARVDVVGLNTRQNAQLVDAISVSGPFQMTSGPALPKSLAPGESFAIRLEPSATAGGDLTGNLVIGDAIFPLAVDIPTLPGVRFSAAGRTLRAGEQVSLGLRLGRTYPVDISGTLQLDLESVDSVSDPSLRWSTGGQQVAFRIPAGATSAVIAGEAEMVAFHAALVSGTITVTARLAAYPWGIDITPASAPQVQFSVEIAELPAVTFSREGGSVGAGRQVELGLSLVGPYPEAVAGTLQLAFEGKDAGSGTGPWAGGGQQVRFRIAAGETGAMFADGFPTTQFRVPVEEGKVTVTARFATEEGGADITPDAAPELLFAVEIEELPEVLFSREGGSVGAGRQVELGLSLAGPYPEAVAGTLQLAFEGKDAGSGTGPWAGGGQQVRFRIATGETGAMFADGFPTTQFRVPVEEGKVTVTARFATEEGGADITPDAAPELLFAVEIEELPEVLFSREGGSVGAGQQVELGLSLAAAYPEAVAGTLQLTFEGKDVGSGMGPWAGGGQLVRFRIAAGEMGAMFADGFPTTQFRVPVEEGKVTVTARFATEEGGADITPDTEPELQFAVEIADLPEVRFSHAGGTVASAEQVDVGLSLAAAYPTDVVGVLALAFETRAFANDPAIQWATGGHQATFQIPAGATDAVFSGNFAANTFQTGTVAGEIVVTARFFSVPDGIANAPRDAEAQAGAGVEITPDTALELRFIVMEGAPVLSRVALDSTGQGRFSLQVTGYSTAREVNSLSFAFTGTAGSNLQTPALEADVSQNFRTYYAGSQSTSYGSQFTATVDFMLDEGVFEDLEGASVTAANGSGQSNSVSVSLN